MLIKAQHVHQVVAYFIVWFWTGSVLKTAASEHLDTFIDENSESESKQ